MSAGSAGRQEMKYQTGACALIASVLCACASTSDIWVHKSVSVKQPLETSSTLWLGSRSARVLNSEKFEDIAHRFSTQLEQIGFQIVDRKADSAYQAYIWFGKRGERRKQFSNVTDGMNIWTEYTWAATFEILNQGQAGQRQVYLAEAETAVWCPSISSVLNELVDELLEGFPLQKSAEGSTLNTYSPSQC